MKEIHIDPRIIRHLGQDLITTSEVAIIELVKNSIDAKATNINLRLYNNSFPQNMISTSILAELVPAELLKFSLLIVEDDGEGMTDAIIESGFLTIIRKIGFLIGTLSGKRYRQASYSKIRVCFVIRNFIRI